MGIERIFDVIAALQWYERILETEMDTSGLDGEVIPPSGHGIDYLNEIDSKVEFIPVNQVFTPAQVADAQSVIRVCVSNPWEGETLGG